MIVEFYDFQLFITNNFDNPQNFQHFIFIILRNLFSMLYLCEYGFRIFVLQFNPAMWGVKS